MLGTSELYLRYMTSGLAVLGGVNQDWSWARELRQRTTRSVHHLTSLAKSCSYRQEKQYLERKTDKVRKQNQLPTHSFIFPIFRSDVRIKFYLSELDSISNLDLNYYYLLRIFYYKWVFSTVNIDFIHSITIIVFYLCGQNYNVSGLEVYWEII